MAHAMPDETKYETAIALIGVAGRFPGARNVEAFWRNITAGEKSIRSFSDEELLAAGVDADLLKQPNYIKAGAVLNDVEMFDASFFKFSPREAEVTDPQHRLFLECAWEALEDAGYNPETYQDLIGVFAGSAFGTYLLNNLVPNREILDLIGPIQTSIGNDKDSLPSMVSYKLNLRGPSIAVQTFCSTSLVATHMACQSLLNFECDIALAGGVAIFLPQIAGYLYEDGSILSPDGECRTFDANGRGSVMGNGVGIVALKRMADAMRDGDQIYAVLLGSAVNNDGSVRVSYTAPGLGGQTEVIAQALSNANVDAETIGYVEAHGTATVLGDAVELAAMKKAFRRDTDKKQFCAIGSLKPNVGHLDRASGVSGLIKAALALKHRVLPPSLNFEHANAEVDLENSPFYVNTRLQAWQAENWPRRAGVSSFGVGGTNAHVVLEEAPVLEPSTPARPWQLVLLSAKTAYSLHAATTNLAAFLKEHPALNLADIAYTLQVGRGSFNHRRFVVGRDHADVIECLQAENTLLAPTTNQVHRDRPVTFLLSDLDPQTGTLAGELYQQEATFREHVDRCLKILRERVQLELREWLVSPQVPASPDKLKQQTAHFVTEYALAQLFAQYGVRPQALLSHGVGEYVAACLADVLTLEDALVLVTQRARWLQSPVAQQATILAELRHFVQTLTLRPPQLPLTSSISGTWITTAEATQPAYWEQQLTQPWRCAEELTSLLQDTESVLLEVGPGQALSALIRQHVSAQDLQLVETLSTSYQLQSERAALLNALGRLWLAGASIDWPALYQDERRLRVSLPTYAFERQRYWLEAPEVLRYREQAAASALITRKPDQADWFYRARWEQVPLADLPPLASRNWLVFMDSAGLAEQLVIRLGEQQRIVRVYAGSAFAQQDEQHFTIRPGEEADYQRLCEALAATQRLPERVAHCWSVSTASERTPTNAQVFRMEQERGFYSSLFLAKALAPHVYDRSVLVFAISTHVQAVSGEELLQPEKATLLGACKVISQEPLNITCRSIDLEVFPGVASLQTAAAQVIAECTALTNDFVVAYRDNLRWAQRYEAVQLTERPVEPLPFRQDGVYLITGGLGGIGLALAEYLARTVRAHIVLVGRSALPARQQWQAWLADHEEQDNTSEKIRRLQTIEALGGQVLICQADAADEGQMHAVVRDTLATFGALHGVFHAAGITNEQSFKAVQDLERDLCEAHFQGKVYGTYALQQALKERKLDFCLLFSSLSATLGGLGFTAYTAANTFLDAFVARYNQSAQQPWVSVNWDTWQVREDVHGDFGATVAAFAMSPAEGIEALRRILASGHTHIINSTGDLEARIRQWIRLESLQETEETAIPGTPGTLPAEDYEPKIAEIWCQVLGVAQVNPHDNFFDLGGNSLVALEVISRLKKAFRRQIPAVALFEAPTISALAKYLRPSVADEPVTGQHGQLDKRRQRARQQTQQEGIAIIGMALRFPGASTIEQFWENLRAGKESITFFSDEELLASGVDPQLLQDPDYVKARPVLDGIDLFDANLFGYSPREAELTDPQHRLFLECAWEAMEQAGYDTRSYEGLIGVFGGTNLSTYLLTLVASAPEMLQSVDGFQIGIGNDKDSLTTAVSYKLNLRGPSFAVQTFCSTSLVATHLACQSLLHGECDMALAGGISIRVPHRVGYLFQPGGQESPDGHCRTFDAKSQGSVIGDGVGIVVLKRLSEALEDGDIIHAVIQGSALNNDGSLKISYSAPSVAGQSEVVVQALASAGVQAEAIEYVEAHGTATELGDPIEVASLTKAYRSQTDKTSYCAIGSLKTNIGHLDRAAGVAGLIKTVLALKHEQIPASLHFETPNPEIDFEQSPFFVNAQLRPWPRHADKPRYAGVNSLGMGGTNVHVVLRDAPQPQPSSPSRPWQLLALSAKTETALEKATANLLHYLRTSEEVELADVAYTLQVGRTTLEQRRVLVCRDRQDAIMALEQSEQRRLLSASQDQRERAVAFLLPGVGELAPGMTRELYDNDATFKAAIDRCCAFIKQQFDLDLHAALYPPLQPETGQNSPRVEQQVLFGRNSRTAEPIKETLLAQPALFVVEYALAQLLMQWGIRPRALLGYSMGEYVAACLAGVLSLEDALTLVTRRAQLIQELPAGAMLAVVLSEEAIQPYLDGQVDLAIVNAPNTCVLAGPVEAIERVAASLRQHEIAHRRVESTHAFHSKTLAPLQAALTELVSSLKLNPPTIPYLSNVTGDWISEEEATDPGYWARHLCETVRFADGVAHLLEETTYALLEVGPGQALGSFVRQHPACERERFSQIVATLPAASEALSDRQALLTALGKLWLAGVTPDWQGLYPGERRQRVILPTYPFEHERYWLEPVNPAPRLRATAAPSSPRDILNTLKKEELANWFYLPTWKMSAPLVTGAHELQMQEMTWLLFIDACGIGADLADALRERGSTVIVVSPGPHFTKVTDTHYLIDPAERADYGKLLQELRACGTFPQRFVHLWSVTEGEQAPAELLTSGFFSLFSLTQELGDAGVERCQLAIISNEMHAVTDDDRVNPSKATLIGPCRVIPQEYEEISCRSIDIILPEARSKQRARLVQQLTEELCVGSCDTVVALRGKRRWVPSLEPVTLAEGNSQAAGLRQRGVYLLTGGLGGIALEMAELLARTVQARLVLLNRSGLPPRAEWEQIIQQEPESIQAERIRKVVALEASGAEVLVLQADVADEQQMRAAYQQIQERFGELHGVFHLAGVPGVGLTQLKQREQVAGVLAPKVQGTLILQRVLKDQPLDFLVLFSSVTSMTGGGPGQIDYCAANAFLDATAQQAQQQEGQRVLSINWGEWQWNAWENGLSGYEQGVQAFFRENRQKFGISFADGAEALLRVLSSGLAHVVVSTQDFRILAEQSKSFTAAYLREQEQQRQQARQAHPRPSLAGSYVPARNDLERQIVAIWEELLGITPVGINDNFFELGGNSLTGIDLIARLRKTLKLEALASHVLYEAPSVGALALHVSSGKSNDVVKGRVARGEKRRDSLKERVHTTRKTK